MFKVIILDFDGVLVESNAIKDNAFKALFADHPGQLEEILDYHRRTSVIRFEKFRYIYEHILHQPYTQRMEQDLAKRFSGYCIDAVIKCPWVAGAQGFLDFFYPKVPLYIVSINPKEDLGTILAGRRIRHFFKDVYVVPADKSASLRAIAARENVRADEAVFIGDSIGDYESAQKAGVHFIGREGNSKFEGIDITVLKDMSQVRDHIMRIGLSA